MVDKIVDSDELTYEDYEILGLEPPEGLKPSEEPPAEEEEERPDEGNELTEGQKYKLLKDLGPDKFYELYPDEAPKKDEPPAEEEEEEETRKWTDIPDLEFEDGPHAGKTLKEVYNEDPYYATMAYNNYLREEDRRVSEEESQKEKEQRVLIEKIDTFAGTISNEKFGQPLDKLNKEQREEVEKIVDETIDWMQETGRGGSSLEDAYMLKNLGSEGKAIYLVKDVVPSMSDGGNIPPSGSDVYDRVLEMTSEQLDGMIRTMGDVEFENFLTNAPPKVRTKFPKFPWR